MVLITVIDLNTPLGLSTPKIWDAFIAVKTASRVQQEPVDLPTNISASFSRDTLLKPPPLLSRYPSFTTLKPLARGAEASIKTVSIAFFHVQIHCLLLPIMYLLIFIQTFTSLSKAQQFYFWKVLSFFIPSVLHRSVFPIRQFILEPTVRAYHSIMAKGNPIFKPRSLTSASVQHRTVFPIFQSIMDPTVHGSPTPMAKRSLIFKPH